MSAVTPAAIQELATYSIICVAQHDYFYDFIKSHLDQNVLQTNRGLLFDTHKITYVTKTAVI